MLTRGAGVWQTAGAGMHRQLHLAAVQGAASCLQHTQMRVPCSAFCTSSSYMLSACCLQDSAMLHSRCKCTNRLADQCLCVLLPPPVSCAGVLLQLLDRRMLAAEGGGSQALASLDSQLAEVEDVVSYVSDLLSLGEGPHTKRCP